MQIFKYDGTIYPAGRVWKIKLALPQMFFGLRRTNARIPLPSHHLLNKIRRYIQRVSSQSSVLIPNWLGDAFEEPESCDPLLAAKNYASLSKKEVRFQDSRVIKTKKKKRTRISLSSSRRKFRVFLSDNFQESRKPRNSEIGQESGCRE